MKKAMVWAVVVAFVWLGVQATPVIGRDKVVKATPGPEMLDVIRHGTDVIQIEITSEGIGYANKELVPIPELTFGIQFDLTVTWDNPAVDSLKLSDFRLVAFDPTAYAKGKVMWPPDLDYSLELQDQDGDPIRDVSFSSADGPSTTRTLILERVENVRTGLPRDPETPQLILFTVSARSGDREFTLDPPWAGKPPTG
jgi:hypothetical protein